MSFVAITDEEGFVTALVGPFTSFAKANKWADKMTAQYEGHLQEPYTVLHPQDPKDFE